MNSPLVRMIDAAINRATEALRVVEDYVRFVLDDVHLTTTCKEVRHQVTAVCRPISNGDRMAARETTRDVGTRISTIQEEQRDDVEHVCTANLKRAAESLRSLEEYAKIVDAELGRQLEVLRYRTYSLQRTISIRETANTRLTSARLYVLIDGGLSEAAFEQLVSQLVEAGAGALQLRDKQLDDRRLVGRARLLVQLCRGQGTLSIINNRVDVAALSGADGVHLGQDDVSVKDARTVVGTRALIGVSTHNLDQARAAVDDGASYLGVGPIFASQTKLFDEFPGLEFARAAAAHIRLPWFAIGGITQDRLDDVLRADATRVAVGNAISRAQDPAEAARQFASRLRDEDSSTGELE